MFDSVKFDTSMPLDALSTLTIVFVILQLTGVIDWSWWWVISPVLYQVILSLFLRVALIAGEHKVGRHNRAAATKHMNYILLALYVVPALTLVLLVVCLT